MNTTLKNNPDNYCQASDREITNLQQLASNKLKQHYKNNLFRSRLTNISKKNLEQKNILNFASNDYLGFANNPELIEKTNGIIHTTGIGSTASNLITGYHTIHQDLELELQCLLNCERVILFPSGFMANLAIADTLLKLDKQNSLAIHDHSNHASILDGSRLSDCKLARYRHNDLEHLKNILLKYNNIAYKFIFTESLFSMDGDIANLNQISKIISKNNSNQDYNSLIIDDSHSFGIHNNGKGLATTVNYNNKLIMGTFGKAIGTAGAYVAGPKILIESLIQFARPYIYTTALSPLLTAATLFSIRLNQQTSEFRDKLFKNITYFHKKLSELDIQPASDLSPIQPIVFGDSKSCIQAAQYLNNHKILLTAIRPPTVAPNQSRLRITLSANHSFENIDYLIKHLAEIKSELNLNTNQLSEK